MFRNKIMLTSFICSVFFILVMSIPLTLYAGPPDREAKCPCFSQREVLRAINKSYNGNVNPGDFGDYNKAVQIFYNESLDDYEVFYALSGGGSGICQELYHTSKGKSGRCVQQYLTITEEEGDACLAIINAVLAGCGIDYDCDGSAFWYNCY